jgi:uncharacterized UBP type Zn finger protein
MCQLRRLYHHVSFNKIDFIFIFGGIKVHQGQKTNEPFVPSQLLYLIWTHENHLAGFEEQDAQELLMALFNIIHSQNSNDNSNKIQSIIFFEILFLFFFKQLMKKPVRVLLIDFLKVLFNLK